MEMTCSREGTEGSLKEAGLEKRVRTKYDLNDDVEVLLLFFFCKISNYQFPF